MSKSNAFETAFLAHVFLNLPIPGIGDATGLPASAVAGSLYLSLHTADPGEAGDQTTSECAYAGYARRAVARSGAGWTVAGDTASPVADTDFPEAPMGSPDITHFGVGTAASGAGLLLWSGPFAAPISCAAQAVIPRLKATSTITED
jgi:hypothetical protein